MIDCFEECPFSDTFAEIGHPCKGHKRAFQSALKGGVNRPKRGRRLL